MNINVWIITKICKALNQSFGETCCCFVLAFYNNPTSILPFSHKPGEEGGLFCQQFLLYKQVLQSSSKCFFSLTGASTSLGLPIIRSSPACLVSAPSLQKTKEKLAFRSTLTPDLPPTFVLLPWSLSGAGCLRLGSEGRAAAAPVSGAGRWCRSRWSSRGAPCRNWRGSPGAPSRTPVLPGTPGNPAPEPAPSQLQEGEARWGRAACREGWPDSSAPRRLRLEVLAPPCPRPSAALKSGTEPFATCNCTGAFRSNDNTRSPTFNWGSLCVRSCFSLIQLFATPGIWTLRFLGGKEPTCNAGDIRDEGSIPGWGRSGGGGHGNPLQHSCLENPNGQRHLTGYCP